jgi:hypothetical protein
VGQQIPRLLRNPWSAELTNRPYIWMNLVHKLRSLFRSYPFQCYPPTSSYIIELDPFLQISQLKFFKSPMRDTFLAHLILLDLIILAMSDKG